MVPEGRELHGIVKEPVDLTAQSGKGRGVGGFLLALFHGNSRFLFHLSLLL
jgi:hypothetical protein